MFSGTGHEEENHRKRITPILTLSKNKRFKCTCIVCRNALQKKEPNQLATSGNHPRLRCYSVFIPASIKFFFQQAASKRCALACLKAGLCLLRLFYLLALPPLTRRSFPTHSLYLPLLAPPPTHSVSFCRPPPAAASGGKLSHYLIRRGSALLPTLKRGALFFLNGFSVKVLKRGFFFFLKHAHKSNDASWMTGDE